MNESEVKTMKRMRTEVYFMSVLLVFIIVLCGAFRRSEITELSFAAFSKGGMEKIPVWEKDNGEGFVFLPSYVDMKHVYILTNGIVSFDGAPMKYGMNCNNLELERRYTVEGDTGGISSITLLQSSNLPTLYIDTDSQSMEDIHRSKEHEESGDIRLYTEEGRRIYNGKMNINGHGNSTFSLLENPDDKRSYNISLWVPGNLLGMGTAENWVLLSNIYDHTNMRNKLVFDFARDAGLRFSPEAQWIDLYLNGNYAGLYLLCEKNEVHQERVNVGKEGSALLSTEITYRLEDQELPYIRTRNGESLRIRYAEMESEILEKTIQSVENALLDPNGIDPISGKHWLELIDLDSWARKYLIEEIFANTDNGLSQFMYLDGNDRQKKLYAGPVWDYDLTMSSPNPNVYVAFKFWYGLLNQQDTFSSYKTKLYAAEFQPLLEEYVDTRIPNYEKIIGQASKLNSIRHNSEQQSPTELQTYLKDRMEFLNRFWIEGQKSVIVDVTISGDTYKYAVFPGDPLPPLPVREGYSWYYTGTDVPVDSEKPVYEELSIELRKNP